MNPPNNTLSIHLNSLFVHHVVIKALMGILASSACAHLSETFLQVHKQEIEPSIWTTVATPLLCVVAALQHICPDEPITDRESLDLVLGRIRMQFDVTKDFPAVGANAMMLLEHALRHTRAYGLFALEEVKAGYPVSGGDLAVWDAHQLECSVRVALAGQATPG